MKDFNYYLEEIGEIGFIKEVVHSIAHTSGLPEVHPNEIVIFEGGALGQVLSFAQDIVEVLILTGTRVKVGTRVVRTGELLQIPVGDDLLGRVVDPLINPIEKAKPIKAVKFSPIDTQPHGIVGREQVVESLETGVTLVDLVVPIAKGQRELVIGDRKTGKSDFLLQVVTSQAARGTVCIYAAIGQRLVEIKRKAEFLREKGIDKNMIIVASSSSDPSGLIFLTPYTSMTIAEFFRDKGRDVLLILDDMSTHARNYREISLLARRFPGRGSYPGDIFYIQARLIERAGNYKTGSITCLPVAESILGDLSGYIQTNLMAMTDGHIFFDIDLYNEGKRPAVSPFLSVTRVGHQAQTPLLKDISRELSSFLVEYERMKQFMHFGAEVGESVRNVLDLGARIDAFFNQSPDSSIPLNVNILILVGIWTGIWNEVEIDILVSEMKHLITTYLSDEKFRIQVDEMVASHTRFSELINKFRLNNEIILSRLDRQKKG